MDKWISYGEKEEICCRLILMEMLVDFGDVCKIDLGGQHLQ